MSQIELIKKPQVQYIKLDDFIPLWSDLIEEFEEKQLSDQERNSLSNTRELDINKSKSCLVGEAHHFSNDYVDDCRICEVFSWRDAVSTYLGSKSISDFKLKLFTHFLETHPEEVMRK